MKILITGGGGQVAYDLKQFAKLRKLDFYAPPREELSVLDIETVHTAIEEYQPDFVINTAAYTAVDRSEKESGYAFTVNFFGAKHVAIACEKLNCPLIHLSTDYVFDGTARRPYLETDPTNPVNVYGESKLRAEEFIQEFVTKFIILRVSAVFGVHGNNFVKTILRLAREKEELRVVSDQVTCPTPARAIAETVLKLCENPTWGIYHYCGEKETSWYDFARKAIAIGGEYESLKVKTIHPIPTTEYPTPAKRPAYSVLDCEKIKKTFGVTQPNWEEGLQHVIKTLSTA